VKYCAGRHFSFSVASSRFGIFVGRNNIRAFRREIVRDLERLFSFARLPNGAPLIIPSFELVKYKYDPESNPDRDLRDNPHSVIYYLLPVSTYIVLTASGFRMAFMPDVKPSPIILPSQSTSRPILSPAIDRSSAHSATPLSAPISGPFSISFDGFRISIWRRSHFFSRLRTFYSPLLQWRQSGTARSWLRSGRIR
jgi:hypothetical protein